MSRNPASDLVQFIAGGALFGSGGFLLANQVMASSAYSYRGGGWGWGPYGSGIPFPVGTPGMGLLMVPLGIGLCLQFAGVYKRWANLLVGASLAALVVGVLNSIRLTFMPTTLWALGTYIAMIGIGGGLMFRSLRDDDENKKK